MRTPAAQAKQNDSRYRWASRSGNMSAPQSRHNRPPKSNALLQLPKKLPAFEFWQVLRPPAAHGRPRWHGWWKFLRLPNICAWSFRPAQNIYGLPPVVEVGWAGGTQSRPKLERWHVFRMGHAFQTSPIQDGVGTAEKHVKNATPSPEIRPEIRPLRQKLRRYVLF